MVKIIVLARERTKQLLIPGNSYLSTPLQSAEGFRPGTAETNIHYPAPRRGLVNCKPQVFHVREMLYLLCTV